MILISSGRLSGMMPVGLVVGLVIGAFFAAPAAGLDAAAKEELFRQANARFRQANGLIARQPDEARKLYRQAAMRYEKLLGEGGLQNGKLYYNAGNVYFRLGDIGRAIVNYRRALRYVPNDTLLRQNLDYARRKRADRIEDRPQEKVLQTVLFWHYDFSAAVRSALFACCFIAAWLLAGIRLYTPAAPRWLVGIVGVIALILFGSLAADEISRARDDTGVILAAKVMPRKGDGETYEPSFKTSLHAGTEFQRIEQRNDWTYIELPDGRRCWVPTKAAAFVRDG